MIHLIEAGHSYKVYGIKGELIISLNPQFQKHILKTGVVFFKLEGNAVPFFIESVRESDDLIVKFKEVNTPEVARELSNQIAYIDNIEVAIEEKSQHEEVEELNYWLHFQIEDLTSGFKGIIKNIEEFPGQLMALVDINDKECMIPIHEDWIEDVNEKQKKILVRLPEGLLEL